MYAHVYADALELSNPNAACFFIALDIDEFCPIGDIDLTPATQQWAQSVSEWSDLTQDMDLSISYISQEELPKDLVKNPMSKVKAS